MPKLSFLEQPTHQINIAQMAIPEVKSGNSVSFKPERDIPEQTKTKWFEFIKGKLEVNSYATALEWVMQLKLLFPNDRLEDHIPLNLLKELEAHVPLMKFQNLSSCAGAQILFPERTSMMLWDEIIKELNRVQKRLELISEMQIDEEKIVSILDDLFNICILFPEEESTLSADNELKDKLIDLVEYARIKQDAWKLSLAAAFLKLVYGKTLLTEEDWKLLRDDFQDNLISYDSLALAGAVHMKVLAAESAFFDKKKGILFEEKTEENPVQELPPQKRNF